MPSQKSPLQDKVSQFKREVNHLQNEIDTYKRVIKIKKPILDELLVKITDANKELDDNFSHKKLQLERNHSEYRKSILQEVESLKGEIEKLEDRKQSLIKECSLTQASLESLKIQTKEEQDRLIYLQSATNTQEKQLNEYTSQLLPLRTDINDAKAYKFTLDKELADKKTAYKRNLTEMLNEAEKEKSRIIAEGKKAQETLKAVKIKIEEDTAKIELAKKDHKQRENALVARENSLIVKTKAFEKEKQEFDLEQRYFKQELKLYETE